MSREARAQHYARFSTSEYDRRRRATREMMDEEGVDALVVYGTGRNRNVDYLANYDLYQNILVFFRDPDEPPTLFVLLSNHLQFAREKSVIDDVRWASPQPVAHAVERVREGLSDGGQVGVAGVHDRFGLDVPHGEYAVLADAFGDRVVDVTAAYERLRLVLSDEEIERLREGAELTTIAMEAVVEEAEPGATEADLSRALESAIIANGGQPAVSFLASAPMEGATPHESKPWKLASDRTIGEGDVITTELTAGSGGYLGQLHRPIAVGREPTDTYADLFDVLEEAYDGILDVLEPGATARDVVDASEPIVEAGYKIDDPILHGWGTGIHAPWTGTGTDDSNFWPAHEGPMNPDDDHEFEANTVVVVQPNAFTPDWTAGFQLGNSVLVTEDGAEVLEDYPVDFLEV